MAELYTFSEETVRAIKQQHDEQRAEIRYLREQLELIRRGQHLLRPRPNMMIGKTDSAISGRSGDVLSSGTVSRYRLIDGVLTDTGQNETAYNLSESSIGSGLYVQCKLDFDNGVWLFDWEDC